MLTPSVKEAKPAASSVLTSTSKAASSSTRQMQDLQSARSLVTFPVAHLTNALYGPDLLAKIKKVNSALSQDPVMRKDDRYFLSRTERMHRAFAQARRMVELRDQNKWTLDEWELAFDILDDVIPISLHEAMFLPVIRAQADEEQKKLWLPLAENYRIIGCYAQTEIGHGSNLSGLETTATFVKETQEFELNSPTLSSAKWWVGGLGLASTHAIVQAKLIIEGKDLGVHPFIVPLRSLDNHVPLPGVIVADIGPKFGFQAIDNGSVRFLQHRIPRRNMLMGFSKVTEDGKYIPPAHPKIAYGGMVLIRSKLVLNAAWALAKATTITTRYCSVRRQFARFAGNVQKSDTKALIGSKEEVTVINHPMVQYRLFPLIAQAYAMHFTGLHMNAMFAQLEQGLANGDVSNLPEVHALSSALKSFCTGIAGDGIEEARKVCGGHGYSASGGFSHLYTNYVAAQTYEGENYLLTQQTIRYLLKKLRKAQKQGPRVFSQLEQYLARTPTTLLQERCEAKSSSDWLDPKMQLAAFGHRAARLLFDTAFALLSGTGWSDLNIECARASHAHSAYVIVLIFQEKLKEIKLSEPIIYEVLKKVCDLYALSTMEKDLSEFMEDGYVYPKQAKWIRDEVKVLLGHMKREVVGLCDAWGFSDYHLNSVLGRNDGNVYDNLYEWSLKEPLNGGKNGKGVVACYEQDIKPLLAGERRSKL